jgi:hypothetical protein
MYSNCCLLKSEFSGVVCKVSIARAHINSIICYMLFTGHFLSASLILHLTMQTE